MTDFKNKLVKKPWGEEYLLYENDNIALWYLKIKEGFRTSLHAHPKKKSGLCVLSGGAQVSFLTDSFKLFPAEKIMIRQGVFHRTKAVVGDVELLEIETPVDKLDLVRLEDDYGRAGEPYEDENSYESKELPELPQYTNWVTKFGSCNACVQSILPEVGIFSDDFTYIILKGQIKSDDFAVAGPGDILYGRNLRLMFEKFTPDPEILTLTLNHAI